MENLMKEYGSLVMTREGKRASIPLTTPEEANSILFGNEEMDKKVRAYIASVKEMDPEWKERTWKNFWWGRQKKDPAIDPRLYEVRDRLLRFGGESVCMTFEEPDADNILRYGQLWHGYGVIKKCGTANRCHGNALEIALKGKGRFRFCTGYALSDDGMWRQHSWCLEKRPRSLKIIETTEPSVLYFGFVLNDKEMIDFRHRLWLF